ncbi:hypothetical protein BC832DRAFT_537088 [Gaertneriomyces semiglobifer]|nr:hypothetical protein BC832DRAFT_537088 [Gaertneriomyces semiglobifer]
MVSGRFRSVLVGQFLGQSGTFSLDGKAVQNILLPSCDPECLDSRHKVIQQDIITAALRDARVSSIRGQDKPEEEGYYANRGKVTGPKFNLGRYTPLSNRKGTLGYSQWEHAGLLRRMWFASSALLCVHNDHGGVNSGSQRLVKNLIRATIAPPLPLKRYWDTLVWSTQSKCTFHAARIFLQRPRWSAMAEVAKISSKSVPVVVWLFGHQPSPILARVPLSRDGILEISLIDGNDDTVNTYEVQEAWLAGRVRTVHRRPTINSVKTCK